MAHLPHLSPCRVLASWPALLPSLLAPRRQRPSCHGLVLEFCGEKGRGTYFRISSSGLSLVSLGTSFGLRSCCVLEGLETYGLAALDSLHS